MLIKRLSTPFALTPTLVRYATGYVYVGDDMKPFFNRDMDVLAIGVGLNKQAAKD